MSISFQDISPRSAIRVALVKLRLIDTLSEFNKGSERHAVFFQELLEASYIHNDSTRVIRRAKRHVEFLLTSLSDVSQNYTGHKCSASLKLLFPSDKLDDGPLVIALARDTKVENTHRRHNDNLYPVLSSRADSSFQSALSGGGFFFSNDLITLHNKGLYKNGRNDWMKDYNATAIVAVHDPRVSDPGQLCIGFLCVDNFGGRFDDRAYREMLELFARGMYDVISGLSYFGEYAQATSTKQRRPAIAPGLAFAPSPVPGWQYMHRREKNKKSDQGIIKLLNRDTTDSSFSFLARCFDLNSDSFNEKARVVSSGKETQQCLPMLEDRQMGDKKELKNNLRNKTASDGKVGEGALHLAMLVISVYALVLSVVETPPSYLPSFLQVLYAIPALVAARIVFAFTLRPRH